MSYFTLVTIALMASSVIGKPVDVPLSDDKCGACFEQEQLSVNKIALPATSGLGQTSGSVEPGPTGITEIADATGTTENETTTGVTTGAEEPGPGATYGTRD